MPSAAEEADAAAGTTMAEKKKKMNLTKAQRRTVRRKFAAETGVSEEGFPAPGFREYSESKLGFVDPFMMR